MSLFVSFVSMAQTEATEAKEFFPPAADSLSIAKTGFYLAEVQDIRANKMNNGFVERNKIKYRLAFQDSLPVYATSFIYPHHSNEAQVLLQPLTIQIEKLRIFSSSNGKFDEAQTYLKLNLLAYGTNEILRSFEQTLTYSKKTQPNFLGKVMYEAFRTAFLGLKAKPSATLSQPVPVKGDSVNPAFLAYRKMLNKDTEKDLPFTYTIPLSDKGHIEWKNNQYYIADIKDIRRNKENEGTVFMGFLNRKAQAFADSNLEFYLKNTLVSTVDPSKTPLTLYVKSFQVSQELTSWGEQRNFYFSGALIYDSAGTAKLLYQNVISIDSTAEKVNTAIWPDLIKSGLSQYFQDFASYKEKPQTVSPLFLGENSYYSSHEIVEEKHFLSKSYLYNTRSLKKLKSMNVGFREDVDSIRHTFITAKTLIYLGRASIALAATTVAWDVIDFLLSQQKDITQWYRNDGESTALLNHFEKELNLQIAITELAGGLICKTLGKHVLRKAIFQHNHSLAERVTLRIRPNLQNQGANFQLNLLLGCK